MSLSRKQKKHIRKLRDASRATVHFLNWRYNYVKNQKFSLNVMKSITKDEAAFKDAQRILRIIQEGDIVSLPQDRSSVNYLYYFNGHDLFFCDGQDSVFLPEQAWNIVSEYPDYYSVCTIQYLTIPRGSKVFYSFDGKAEQKYDWIPLRENTNFICGSLPFLSKNLQKLVCEYLPTDDKTIYIYPEIEDIKSEINRLHDIEYQSPYEYQHDENDEIKQNDIEIKKFSTSFEYTRNNHIALSFFNRNKGDFVTVNGKKFWARFTYLPCHYELKI